MPITTDQAPVANEATDAASLNPSVNKVWKQLKSATSLCKTYRRKLISLWTVSIDYRRGKPFASQTDEDRIAVNLDWSLTKAKQASLFSQVPQVRLDHSPETQQLPWIGTFEEKLNDSLVEAGIEAAMDECLPDCINAAGFGVVLVAHESLTEQVEIPSFDISTLPPEHGAAILQTGQMPDGSDIPTTTMPRIVDHRYTVSRISPSDFLWPINFTGSDFDNAPWIGRSGRISWAQAKQRFNLSDDNKDKILGEEKTHLDKLTHDIDKDKTQPEEMVGFDEIFYKEYQFDSEAKSFNTIWHVVFVNGEDEPVINEPWKGQKIDPQTNQITGASKYPIRVLTLTYITDETIPPSDSAIGRPQINEINKSRTQMILQRERSLPIRTFDVNRIDPTIGQALMRGTWQNMIPVQGNAANIITEVSRAAMPPENFRFDQIAKSDLSEVWQIGSNQQGDGANIETKAEADVVQSNFQTRISHERSKVAKFVIGIAQVLGGLLCLYEDPSAFGKGFDPAFSKALNYSILVDSTVVLDANQRLQKCMQFINFTAKSGWVNLEPVLREIATLSGLDPNSVIQAPQPKPPVEPNISLRLTGTQDLMNPLALAFLIKSGQAPPPQLIDQALQLIAKAVTPMPNAPSGMPPPLPGPGAPNLVTEQIKAAAPGAPPLPLSAGGPVPPTPTPPHAAGPIIPPPPPPTPGNANPNWSSLDRVNKRTGDKK